MLNFGHFEKKIELLAPAGRKVTPAGGKVLYGPLELLYRPLELLYRPLQPLYRPLELERAVKCYFTARQSRENRHVKKKRGRQNSIDFIYVMGGCHLI